MSATGGGDGDAARIESLSAVTLSTRDMTRAVAFYERLGLSPSVGGAEAAFTTFWVGDTALNLMAVPEDGEWQGWGRVILRVSDVDAMHRKLVEAGLSPEFAPRDAPWGERYFHVRDPDGHEISLARPSPAAPR